MEVKLTYAKSGKEEVLNEMKKVQIDFESESVVISHSLNKDIKEYISFKTLNNIKIK